MYSYSLIIPKNHFRPPVYLLVLCKSTKNHPVIKAQTKERQHIQIRQQQVFLIIHSDTVKVESRVVLCVKTSPPSSVHVSL